MEYKSWDTASQPTTSEKEEKEWNNGEKQDQVKGFINTITDVFDYHEEEGDSNGIFRALSQ